VGPPAIVVETRDANNDWAERGRLLPRFENSVCAFDLKPYLAGSQSAEVRLRSISHATKYHSIDFAALYTGSPAAISVTALTPKAAWFGSESILATLGSVDGNRFRLSSGEKFFLSFTAPEQAQGNVRDFVFRSRGYYIPNSGSYLVFTWDGSRWLQRDSFTYPGTDAMKSYDLSLFLPDPNGELRVRVWQDYQYEPAGIDYVTMSVDGSTAPLNYAWDHRKQTDIFSIVEKSDDSRTEWSSCPRNRVTEYAFTSSTTNIPPRVIPVITVAGDDPTNRFTIHWTYVDFEGCPQSLAEVQLWTGPGATGINLWNPSPFVGTNLFVVYGGPALGEGVYYLRVRSNDGTDWGPWAEGTWPPGSSECQVEIASASAPAVNRQTGLLEQRVVVTNTCAAPSSAPQRVLISSLPEGVSVYNATGTTPTDTPFVQYSGEIPANGSITLTIEYYAASRATFTPVLTLETCAAITPPGTDGTALSITRSQMLPGGSFLLEFVSIPGMEYQVQYSSGDLVAASSEALPNWVPAVPTIKATANRTQWVDSGPPKTSSPPVSGVRLYRVIALQNNL
jgi:hypothetical protein